ncbi:DNA-cytosine methyltransferase [Mollivirus sibericum]|uniref:methyltransferase n=1 Tax=Mollivirus sibericum TaxID=1678078 RepID=UPI0006B2EB9E|nr:methyltransferase [Mollivirus sibericum]ALD62018.1 DNA-cytosine methyltransferase [Mollivirus sibericum]
MEGFYNEDALSTKKDRGMIGRLEVGSVDLVICDPPFGITARNTWDTKLDLDVMFAQLERVTKPEAAVIFFSQGMLTAELMTGPWKRYYRTTLVWRFNKPRGFLNASRRPLVYHCDIVIFYRKQCTYNPQMVASVLPVHGCKRKATSVNYGHAEGGVNKRAGAKDRFPGSVIEFPVVNAEDPDKFHPTQKPVDLCRYLIDTYSNPGDLVVDFCAGSGTTGVAALASGRRFVGFETNADYHARASDRLEKCTEPTSLPPAKKHKAKPRRTLKPIQL